MQTIQTHTWELNGTSYEIGRRLGEKIAALPTRRASYTTGLEGFGPAEQKRAARLFDRWCPGLTEELAGFADALATPLEYILYYAMTYLRPRCSHIALLPGITAEGKPLLARNYEFHHEAEDFCLAKTSVTGKYTHLGTSVLYFGREDGFNEQGLAVTMSSCGFPVGALPSMRAPRLEGLQYWAVLRAILENCRDVEEALAYLEGMPIAYNLNMILLDKAGHAALLETLDGRTAIRRMGPDSPQQTMWAANHAVLPPFASIEPRVMAHSARRFEYIRQQVEGKRGITRQKLKKMLLARYPDGLCCHYYEEFFGTTKSMVLSPADGIIELCWGGREENGWHSYDITQPLEEETRTVEISLEKAAPGTFDWLPLK